MSDQFYIRREIKGAEISLGGIRTIQRSRSY